MAARFKEGSLVIPPPPASVETWPMIGAPLKSLWSLASQDLSEAVRTFAPQIKIVVPGLFSVSAGIGLTVVQFALSIVVAGVLLANARTAYEVTCSLGNRLFGEKGPEFQQLIGATIRSVTTGILGVAFIQSILAGLGFLVAGLPGRRLVGGGVSNYRGAASRRVGPDSRRHLHVYDRECYQGGDLPVWCIFVALIDNVLKPLLLGRGVAVPTVVVFLGAIGGFVAIGHHRLVYWCDRPVRGLQALPCLGSSSSHATQDISHVTG